ncbi:MAG: diacylglycerol kinase [Saprospiraceae bacterium]|nr:diacylglycerol kinase [Saprospiraceae bacterium]
MEFKAEEIIFIINPHSGKRKPQYVIRKIRKLNPDYNIFISDSIVRFQEFIDNNLEKYKVFVMAGGDGAINLAASYLFGRKDKILAIIPIGSGNGFARENGFTTDLFKLQKALDKGDSFMADGMEINGRKFINVAGIGFDAFVAHTFAGRKGRGFFNYGIATLQCLTKFKPMHVKISFGKDKIEGEYSMVTMANTRQFGNNALIAPKAHAQSRKLDLVLVKPFPLYYYPIFVSNMFTGKIKQSRYIDYLSLDKDFTLETYYNMYHVDGEPLFFDGSADIKIYKGILSILKMGR